jgi:hypothetical protein
MTRQSTPDQPVHRQALDRPFGVPAVLKSMAWLWPAGECAWFTVAFDFVLAHLNFVVPVDWPSQFQDALCPGDYSAQLRISICPVIRVSREKPGLMIPVNKAAMGQKLTP